MVTIVTKVRRLETIDVYTIDSTGILKYKLTIIERTKWIGNSHCKTNHFIYCLLIVD